MFINPTSGAAIRGVVKVHAAHPEACCTVTATTLRLNNHGAAGRSIGATKQTGLGPKADREKQAARR